MIQHPEDLRPGAPAQLGPSGIPLPAPPQGPYAPPAPPAPPAPEAPSPPATRQEGLALPTPIEAPVAPVPPVPPARSLAPSPHLDSKIETRVLKNALELAKDDRFKNFAQTSFPVTVETFTTHANTPNGTETVHLPLTIEALPLRKAVLDLMGLSSNDARHLVYTFTGGVSPLPPPKSFTTLEDVEEAIRATLDYAGRARRKPKGLKIMNRDPVPKSAAVVSLIDRGRRQEKESKKAIRSKQELERMKRGPVFIQELLRTWRICSIPGHDADRCYICPRTYKHLPLTHRVCTQWAIEHERNPSGVTVLVPPNALEWDFKNLLSNQVAQPAKPSKLKAESKVKKESRWSPGDEETLPIYIDVIPNEQERIKQDTARLKARLLPPPKREAKPVPIELNQTPTPPPKAESPDYIDSGSDSGYSGILCLSAASTRLPSPCELRSPPISLFFHQLQATYPNLNFTSFISRLDAFGIRFAYELAEPNRGADWLVEYIRMPVREADIARRAAISATPQSNGGPIAGPSHF
ncbi:hypothetical protein FRC12_001391 [Ceratobasidium sp. 428]|nr:hypothetical protein FRC12_001391 [Ceratobasidium sp. 428]